MKKKLSNFKTPIILRINEDDSGIALCYEKLMSLNEIAVKFLLSLENNMPDLEIVELIYKDYDINRDLIINDLNLFKKKLKKMEIL